MMYFLRTLKSVDKDDNNFVVETQALGLTLTFSNADDASWLKYTSTYRAKISNLGQDLLLKWT